MKEFIKKIIPRRALLQYHRFLAVLAKLLYGNPSKHLAVIGVTGTDGKTSSVILISEILDAAGISNGYMTTAEFKIGEKKWINETKQTMPGRFQLQKLLRQAVDQGCTHMIIETSSQGIEQFRHLGVAYDVALFTNLSEDHLEAHGSFEQYRKEKVKLFSKVSRRGPKDGIPTIHVINSADKNAAHFIESGKVDQKVGFYINGDEIHTNGCDRLLVASGVDFNGKGLVFDISEEGGDSEKKYHIKTPLIGRFNVYNILGASAVVRALGISDRDIIDAFARIHGIPGRLELINEGQDFSVIVDYAHAENALRNVFETIKPIAKKRIISVLGSCGGGRDVKKRPVLGKIAAENADIVIVTNEDPYDEDPEEIIDHVASGVIAAGKKEGEGFFKVSNRRDAVERAIKKAEPGDIVLLTGKGSEQCIMSKGGKQIPWDDRSVAREFLRELQNNQK